MLYKICYSTERYAEYPCSIRYYTRTTISSLQPSTKYFVTVSAGNSVGFGPRSAEIGKITNGGMDFAWMGLSQNLEFLSSPKNLK